MKKLFFAFLLFGLMNVWLSSCESDQMKTVDIEQESPSEPTFFLPETPAKFPPLNVPEDNPISKEGVALGRMLFYDPMLHHEESMSCATCHQQEYAFSSADHQVHDLELGIMPHLNLGWDKIFLWHGEVEGTLEDIMLFEVKEFFQADLSKFNDHPQYPQLFKNAFGAEQIGYEELAKALAQFERTLISGNSKFDQYLRNEVQLSESEYRGFNLFYSEDGDCFHCHGTVLFKDNLYHNNGLNQTFEGTDQGHFMVTGDSMDLGRFKTPTLRNIELTAPYMHDNRFSTLKEVVDFYSDNVHFTPFTDPLMNHEGGINLTEDEKIDLINFLKTLTDTSFINNPALSDPFVKN
ncbi:MAG: cytochrome-c peroxidase [Candidatus Cyclobacteriaceae bacterium M3_2C_046]